MKFIRVKDNGGGKSAEELQNFEETFNHVLLNDSVLQKKLADIAQEHFKQLLLMTSISDGRPLFSCAHPITENAPELESELSDDSLEIFEYDDELDSPHSS